MRWRRESEKIMNVQIHPDLLSGVGLSKPQLIFQRQEERYTQRITQLENNITRGQGWGRRGQDKKTAHS